MEASTGIEPVYTDLQSAAASACADFQLALAVVLDNKIRIPAIRRSKAGQRLGQNFERKNKRTRIGFTLLASRNTICHATEHLIMLVWVRPKSSCNDVGFFEPMISYELSDTKV